MHDVASAVNQTRLGDQLPMPQIRMPGSGTMNKCCIPEKLSDETPCRLTAGNET